jgi:hypothetical protein
MSKKTYFRYLTHEDRMRCQIEADRGQVTKFVIQYEILAKGNWVGVTRFDTAHDIVHRDLISPDGLVKKQWFLQLNFDEGLTFAYNDIEANWLEYRQWYISKVRETK